MVMTALIIIGLINGLALLPVLLSLIGPPSEVSYYLGETRKLIIIDICYLGNTSRLHQMTVEVVCLLHHRYHHQHQNQRNLEMVVVCR
jgi:hypothetical protein